jgi:hypothetical protein
MIDQKEAAKVVARMAQMHNYPNPKFEPAAFKELVNACAVAKDIETAHRIVGEFISTANSETKCPMPADLRRVLYAAAKPEYYEQKFADSPAVTCSACSDTGCAGGLNGEPWRWCECAEGVRLKQASPNRVEQLNAMNTVLPRPTQHRSRSMAAVTDVLERV